MSNIHEGVLMVRGKGTGFIAVPDQEEDILIAPEALNFGLDGDLVKYELSPKVTGKRQEARVIEVVESAREEFIGTVKESEKGSLYFQADNRRIHKRFDLKDEDREHLGMKVVAKIARWTQPQLDPLGVVIEVIGRAGDHETEMQAIIRGGGFSEEFTPSIAEAAHDLYNRQSDIFKEAEMDPERRDIRGVTTFTIDPADAKDFDDALSFQKLENGNVEIGIHIADVSHYVREGDEIDKEAMKRATSIYLVDRVIPMLPEVLSNDLCSLRPNEDRLAFSAVFELDNEAQVVSEWYGQTIIHSDRRFTYEEAQEILTAGQGDHYTELETMMKLSRKIRQRRFAAGAIAFEQPEVRFELDANGVPIRAYTKERTETMMMIEDYMLLANQSVATHIHKLCKDSKKNEVFIYRIHDVPNPDKIEELASFIHALGYEFKTDQGVVAAKDINEMLKQVEGKPEEQLIKTATIRSMAKAIYSTKNIGHFGLAFKFYTHFTSPIRRYPDMLAHRMLRRHLDGSTIETREIAGFERISVQSSEREMEAVRAERNSIKYKQVEYMAPHIGEEFDGVITGVSDFGIFVAEKESQSEGMIHISKLGTDFFEHLPSAYTIKGQRSGKTFRLGDEIRFKVANADLEEKKLDYELVEQKV